MFIRIAKFLLIFVLVAAAVVLLFTSIGTGQLGAASTSLVVIVAVWAIWQNRNITKENHTLSFIRDYNSDARVDAAHRFIRDSVIGHSKQAIADSYRHADQRANFLFLMNKFEILAVGLERGLYDKKLVDKIFDYDICEIYDSAKPLIDIIRETENSSDYALAFENFEKLAAETKPHYLRKRQPAARK